jgi:hypothetical protein
MMGNHKTHFNIRSARMAEEADTPAQRNLSPAAQRALAEAEARRKAARHKPAPPKEIGGRGGEEPVRYGDWEVKGIATDF